ncbi:hypothetical protein BKA82DRAFT_541657 [Pisolithus tinctorius]|uniref:Uncharacterized protein n=1 Tax=Pisolithus tinctorius Marx 270 TaxID=870435 RepID=A0A0C3K5N7_PISTI|nr:hypothetical protein BKA82DRAFT_541657 [Pisolithus tinctorius]KIO04862.1 hypothetical protein M404DRAFT_541657 [Pisolithus tinctorius Marx 270]
MFADILALLSPGSESKSAHKTKALCDHKANLGCTLVSRPSIGLSIRAHPNEMREECLGMHYQPLKLEHCKNHHFDSMLHSRLPVGGSEHESDVGLVDWHSRLVCVPLTTNLHDDLIFTATASNVFAALNVTEDH